MDFRRGWVPLRIRIAAPSRLVIVLNGRAAAAMWEESRRGGR
jgi:hypothetical protein